MAQTDAAGNVNVSRFGRRLAGAGGFINISQTAKKLLLAGTFTTGGLKIEIQEGRLGIAKEGKSQKFIDHVEQITFSGRYAAESGQPVYYVTERCVFQRTAEGVELMEIAPGIDPERDILPHMGFRPIMRGPQAMNPLIFKPEPMGLEQLLLGLSLAERIIYDQERNTIFINFEGFQVRTTADVDLVRREMETRCRAIGRKVALVANYDGFYLDPIVSDAYFSMITYMQNRYYSSASRYTTSAFMRLKLGAGLAERNLAPHIFETWPEAQAFSAAQTRS
jgi:propionate CoA-transferase